MLCPREYGGGLGLGLCALQLEERSLVDRLLQKVTSYRYFRKTSDELSSIGFPTRNQLIRCPASLLYSSLRPWRKLDLSRYTLAKCICKASHPIRIFLVKGHGCFLLGLSPERDYQDARTEQVVPPLLRKLSIINRALYTRIDS